jgi:hypothetical protein
MGILLDGVLCDDLVNRPSLPEEKKFEITDENKANWAIKTIKENNERKDLYINVCKAEIEELQRKIKAKQEQTEGQNSFLLFKLKEYLQTVPTKKAKNSESLELPNGTIRLKYAKKDFKKDENVLIDKLKGTDFVENTYKLKWGEFKKLLEVSGDIIVRTDTGEAVDGVTIEETDERVEVE